MDLIAILEQLNIPFLTEGNPHCRPGWVQIDCPFCGRDTQKFHLGISLQKGNCNCWKCGPHSLVSALVEITNKPVSVIKQLLEQVDAKPIIEQKQNRVIKTIPPIGVGPLLKQHIRYLKGRGFSDVEIQQIEEIWKVGGIGIGGRLSWRLYIPIYQDGKLASWTTRSITDSPMRYIFAPREQSLLPKTKILYGIDYVDHAVIITEGPIDVWKIGPGAVCLCGMNFSNYQINRLSEIPIRTICFDNEPEAQKRAQALADLLGAFPGETYLIQLDSKDAGSATKKEIEALRRMLK